MCPFSLHAKQGQFGVRIVSHRGFLGWCVSKADLYGSMYIILWDLTSWSLKIHSLCSVVLHGSVVPQVTGSEGEEPIQRLSASDLRSCGDSIFVPVYMQQRHLDN